MDFGLDFFFSGFGSYYILRTSAWLACALWTTTYRSAHERERNKAIDTDEYKNVREGDLKHGSVSVDGMFAKGDDERTHHLQLLPPAPQEQC